MRWMPAAAILTAALLACGGSAGGGKGGAGGSGGASGGGSGGTGGTGAAPLHCADVWICVSRCASGDQGCVGDCNAAADPASWSLVVDMATCMSAHSCTRPSTCAGCAAEVASCQDDGLSSYACPDLKGCIDFCAGDTGCEDICRSHAQPGAAQALQDYQDCLSQFGCMDTDATCISLNCGTQQAACFGG